MIVYEFEVTFHHKGRPRTFTRWERADYVAVDSARDGFKAAYGSWPSTAPLTVRTGREATR